MIGRGRGARQVWQELFVGADDVALTKRPEWLDVVCAHGPYGSRPGWPGGSASAASPRAKFEAVSRALGRRCVIAIARRHGEPVAGVVVLSQGPVATFWRGAMDTSSNGSPSPRQSCAAGPR